MQLKSRIEQIEEMINYGADLSSSEFRAEYQIRAAEVFAQILIAESLNRIADAITENIHATESISNSIDNFFGVFDAQKWSK